MPVIIMGLGYWDQEICDGELKYTEGIWFEEKMLKHLHIFNSAFLKGALI